MSTTTGYCSSHCLLSFLPLFSCSASPGGVVRKVEVGFFQEVQLVVFTEPLSFKELMHSRRYIVNDGTKLLWMTIYVLGNIALFLERFFYYYKGPGAKVSQNPGPQPAADSLCYLQLFPVYGFGIPIARGAATALKLNCAIILLPVCRNLMSW